ncbi:DUF5681 domain-containing protein [Methylocystis rosea]|uniref:DUF5681 domain-containing protein n=1 Tax=Methylocystis rosea TaxID=173366 RepID=UPI000381781E|nr:DUF5681 domain-containing protein [Methylocystis rosea]
MNDRKRPSPPDGEYSVGYGRPPQQTRFQPGRSGNPKGRPKGSRSVGAILQHIIRQKIAVTENGKTRWMSTLEVMFRRLVRDALRSDARAMKLLLSLVDRYCNSPESALPLGDVLAEDRSILAQYLSELAESDSASTISSEDGNGGDGV